MNESLNEQLIPKVEPLEIDETEPAPIKKMSNFSTYIALVKGYCGLLVLVIPRQFRRGGLVFAPILMTVSGIVEWYCCMMLVKIANKINIHNYSLIAEKVLGRWARILSDIMIIGTQFSFILCYILYIVQSSHDILFEKGIKLNLWVIASLLSLIVIPVTLIRELNNLKCGFVLGVVCILASALISLILLQIKYEDNGYHSGKNIMLFNPETYLSFVGFSIYSWEAIGIIMPIMDQCEKPQDFGRMLLYCIITLNIFYLILGDLSYFYLGDELTGNFITQDLNQKSVPVIIVIVVVCINMIFSYAINATPIYVILEYYTMSCLTKSSSTTKYHCQTVLRISIYLLAIVSALCIYNYVQVFISLLGAVFCAPLAITMPALIHYKEMAQSKKERVLDMFIIIGSIFVLILSTY